MLSAGKRKNLTPTERKKKNIYIQRQKSKNIKKHKKSILLQHELHTTRTHWRKKSKGK